MGTLEITLPPTWHRIDIQADREAELDRIARDMTKELPADSAAPARHRFTESIRALVESTAASEGASPLLLSFPTGRGLSRWLPITFVVGTLPPPPPEAKVSEVMLTYSQNDRTSVPVAIADTMGIRTHAITDVTDSVVDTMRDLTGSGEDAEQEIEGPRTASLRARYVFGWQGEQPLWTYVAATGLVGADDRQDDIVADYLGLFDAIVSTARRQVTHDSTEVDE